MISFGTLPALARGAFALWGLLLCLTNIASAALAFIKKHYRFTAFAFIQFAPVYFMWQVIFDLSLFGETDAASVVTKSLCSLPWLIWLGAFVALTLTGAILFGLNLKYDKTFITPGTIKLYLDRVPCGICCWRENGRVLFSNICMNELCVAITDNSLLNGNHFCDAVDGSIQTVNGKILRFVSRETELDGERLREMIASDITAEYEKTRALENDKAELSRLNNELAEYYFSIDESVKRQEILQAKINIHDEMNRLMLSNMAANRTDAAALDNIFSLWEQNALLLCMEADKKANAKQSDAFISLAKALDISIIWESALPAFLSEKQKELFFFAAQEALVNAVKHAQATALEISFEQGEGALLCRFTNNGKTPNKEVSFAGGLANIALLAEKQGASLYTEIGEKFTLVLCLKL